MFCHIPNFKVLNKVIYNSLLSIKNGKGNQTNCLRTAESSTLVMLITFLHNHNKLKQEYLQF